VKSLTLNRPATANTTCYQWLLFILAAAVVAMPAQSQTIQHAHCTQAVSCSLPNPTSPGDMLIEIGTLPSLASNPILTDTQGDIFNETYTTGWYGAGDPGPLWYAIGIAGGHIKVQSTEKFIDIYLAEYPPAALDQVSGQTLLCCAPSATVGPLTTTAPSELLIAWDIGWTPTEAYPNTGFAVEDTGTSISVEDASVSPGTYTFNTQPGGARMVSFTLIGQQFTKYKAPYTPIQVKTCAPPAPCTFDDPVQLGDMLVVVASQSHAMSDSAGSTWKLAFAVPYTGIEFWYALNANEGVDTVNVEGSSAVIVEYPPSLGPDGANYGTYAGQNVDSPNGQSDDVGWTLPIQTTQPCDLLVVGGLNNIPPGPDNSWKPAPSPYFTVRAGTRGILGLEDGTSSIPGVYFGTMDFNDYYTHWLLGMVAFNMNGCKGGDKSPRARDHSDRESEQ
jgi:hypothetical protein